MKTRIRFTTADGTPLTYEAGGKTHTMDRVIWTVLGSPVTPEAQADLYRMRLAHLADIDPYDIQIHLDPLPGPSPDAAELAALLGE